MPIEEVSWRTDFFPYQREAGRSLTLESECTFQMVQQFQLPSPRQDLTKSSLVKVHRTSRAQEKIKRSANKLSEVLL